MIHSNTLNFKMFKWAVATALFITLIILSLPNKNLEIVSESQKCDEFICKYEVVIKNRTSKLTSGYLKVIGEIGSSNAYKSQAVYRFHSEKIHVSLESNESIEYSGVVKSPINSDQYLMITIVTLE